MAPVDLDADPHARPRANGRVVGVLVTFRRPEQLARHLEVLARQERPPDHLVLVDNDPMPANEAALDAYRAGGTSAEYLPSPGNLGPAGGLALGMERAVAGADDEDWLLLLDDDDPPASDDLVARLVEVAAAAGPGRRLGAVGVAGAPFDWSRGRLRRFADEELQGVLEVDELGGNQLPLYRVAAVREVGVFDADLFFGFDDLDYGLRLRRAGWDLAVSGELLAAERRRWDRTGAAGVAAARRTRQPPWRRYYTVRNLVAVLRKHGADRTAAVAGLRAGVAGPLVEVRRSPADGVRHLVAGLRGLADGWTGRLGPTVVPTRKTGTG